MSAPCPRRLRRLALPAGLLGLLTLLTLVAFVRGTWADTVPREPARVEDGPVCQVYRPPGGAPEVRCAIRLPFGMDEVWAAVTDYDHYGDICACVRAESITHDPAGTCRLEARACSGVGVAVPFAVELRHEQKLDEYVASWDQASGRVLVNRGAWVLRPTGPKETLVVLSLEVQVKGVPTFILRNLWLYRLREVVLGVKRRLQSGGPGQKW
jgi:hypothetical protein